MPWNHFLVFLKSCGLYSKRFYQETYWLQGRGAGQHISSALHSPQDLSVIETALSSCKRSWCWFSTPVLTNCVSLTGHTLSLSRCPRLWNGMLTLAPKVFASKLNNQKVASKGWGFSSEHLLHIHEALGCIPNTTGKKYLSLMLYPLLLWKNKINAGNIYLSSGCSLQVQLGYICEKNLKIFRRKK